MIKEKTVYYSTKTDKEYDSLVEAVLEDTAADSNADDVKDLLQKYRNAKDAFDSEIRSARGESEKALADRVGEIHSKYDGILDQLTEQLSRCGVNPSDVFQKCNDKVQDKRQHRRRRVVKVHVAGTPNCISTRRSL